jgi:competence protein ComEC
MLIDGGGSRNDDFDMGRAVVAPALYHLGVRRVDYVVLSHPHQDHAGGLAYILEHFNAKELWLTQTAAAEMAGQRLMLAARRSGVRQRILSAEADPMLIEGVCISFLNPLEDRGQPLAAGRRDANNDSLVMRVGFKDVGFLFTGDIRGEQERMLVHAERPLQATVLKVPHHGRPGSSLPEFVHAIAPQIAVISCRPFGREKVPAAAVLETYRQARAQVYRTDMHGAVTITTDGFAYSIEPCIAAIGTSGQPGEVY